MKFHTEISYKWILRRNSRKGSVRRTLEPGPDSGVPRSVENKRGRMQRRWMNNVVNFPRSVENRRGRIQRR